MSFPDMKYGQLAGLVVEAFSFLLSGDGAQKKCVLAGRPASYGEFRLVLIVCAMFASVALKQPLAVAIAVALVKGMIDSGRVNAFRCYDESTTVPSTTETTIITFMTALPMYALLPTWVLIAYLLLRVRATATVSRAMVTNWAPLQATWQLLAMKMPPKVELSLLMALHAVTGDGFWLLMVVILCLKKRSDGFVRFVLTYILWIYGHSLMAVAFYLLTKKPTKQKMLTVLVWMIIANAMVPTNGLAVPTNTYGGSSESWNSKSKHVMAVSAFVAHSALPKVKLPFKTTLAKKLLFLLVFLAQIGGVAALSTPLTQLIGCVCFYYVFSVVFLSIREIMAMRSRVRPQADHDYVLRFSTMYPRAYRRLERMGHDYVAPPVEEDNIRDILKIIVHYMTIPFLRLARLILTYPGTAVVTIILVYFAEIAQARPLGHDKTLADLVTPWASFVYTIMSFSARQCLTGFANGVYSSFVTMYNWSPLPFIDVATYWVVLIFAVGVLNKRVPITSAFTTIMLTMVLRWSGLDAAYWFVFWVCQIVNVFMYSFGSYPKLPGMLPMAFIMTIQPMCQYFFYNIAQGTLVVPMWYFAVFFGTLALECTPIFAHQTLVIERDVITGKVIKQERKNGPLTMILFGHISATWDAVQQSASIGSVVEGNRFTTAIDKIKKLHMLIDASAVGHLDKGVEIVTDNRASGYVTINGQFCANCQAVTQHGLTGILTNIHVVYNEDGKVRPGLKFHFPGQEIETSAVPAVSYAGHDLCILSPEVSIKVAYGVTNAIPTTVFVCGYHHDKTPFNKVCTQKGGLTQLDLRPGHSGTAMINPENGKICGILWLSAEAAHQAQFISLNPWALTRKSDLGWPCQSNIILERRQCKTNLNDIRQKLALARRELMVKNSGRNSAVDLCCKKLEALEASLECNSEEMLADLVQEHKLYLTMAQEVLEEKKNLLQRMRFYRTEKEKLLREKNSLTAVDTTLVSDLRKQAKELQKKLTELDAAVQDEIGYKPPEEARMPIGLPQINWPLIYRDGNDWHVYWSRDEHTTYDTTPLSNPEVLDRVMQQTGLQRKAAIRYCAGHLYNKEWATSMLQKINLEPSVFRGIIDWWFSTSRTICSYCDRKFECSDNHVHGDSCTKKCIMDCERHMEYCGSNSYKPDGITVDGWHYPINGGKVSLGYKNFYVARCCQPHSNCVTSHAPPRRSDYHLLNGNGETQWWIRRTCIENLHKQYKATDVAMPENESVMEIIARQNEYKNMSESTCETTTRAFEALKQENETLFQTTLDSREEIDVLHDTIERLRQSVCREAENVRNKTREIAKLNDKIEKLTEVQSSLTATHSTLVSDVATEKNKTLLTIRENEKLERKVSELTVQNAKLEAQLAKKSPSSEAFKVQEPEQAKGEWETKKSKKNKKKNKSKVDPTEATVITMPVSSDEEMVESKFPITKKNKWADDGSPQNAFVQIKTDMHKQWNDGALCLCHWCRCKDECLCPTEMCVWCNEKDHDTEGCIHAKTGDCACGGSRSYKGKISCCMKTTDRCVVCEGNHHSMKCHAWNHRYWEASNRVDSSIYDKTFKKPDFP